MVMLRFVDIGFGYFAFGISLRSADGGGGKKTFFNVFVFCSLVAASPSNVGMKVLMGVELRYLLTFQMSCSSASLMNFCHVSHLLSFIFCLNVCRCSFHSSSSSCLPYLLNLRRVRSDCFRSFSNSLFHHLLLNGHMSALSVVSLVARLIAVLMSFAS